MVRRAKALSSRRIGVALCALLALSLSLLVIVSPVALAARLAPRIDHLLSRFGPPTCEGDAWAAKRIVAHAGGEVAGQTYTNAVEAIERNAGLGCRWFEVDFSWTADDRLVAIHDWNAAAGRIFGPASNGSHLTRDEFLATERVDGLTSLDLERALETVGALEGAVLVPDLKWEEQRAAERLAAARGRLAVDGEQMPQVALQAYAGEQVGLANRLGFEMETLTLYRSQLTDDEVVDLVRRGLVRQLTLPIGRAFGRLPGRLEEFDVELFVHTVNSPWLAERLFSRGIDGLYSDSLCGCRGAQ